MKYGSKKTKGGQAKEGGLEIMFGEAYFWFERKYIFTCTIISLFLEGLVELQYVEKRKGK